MDLTALAAAVGVILAVELLLGHLLLFVLLHQVARLPASTAIRLAHLAGLALGYTIAACLVPLTAPVLAVWAGAPLVPGGLVLGAGLVWLLLVLFLPPGFAGEGASR